VFVLYIKSFVLIIRAPLPWQKWCYVTSLLLCHSFMALVPEEFVSERFLNNEDILWGKSPNSSEPKQCLISRRVLQRLRDASDRCETVLEWERERGKQREIEGLRDRGRQREKEREGERKGDRTCVKKNPVLCVVNMEFFFPSQFFDVLPKRVEKNKSIWKPSKFIEEDPWLTILAPYFHVGKRP